MYVILLVYENILINLGDIGAHTRLCIGFFQLLAPLLSRLVAVYLVHSIPSFIHCNSHVI